MVKDTAVSRKHVLKELLDLAGPGANCFRYDGQVWEHQRTGDGKSGNHLSIHNHAKVTSLFQLPSTG